MSTDVFEKQSLPDPVCRVLLLWDSSRAPFIFGGALMLVEEGLAHCKKSGRHGMDLAVVGAPGLGGNGTEGAVVVSHMREASSPVAEALIGIEGCDRLVLASSEAVLREWIKAQDGPFEIVPGLAGDVPEDYHLGSGLGCSQIHAEGGELPPLSMANELNQWADDLLSRHSKGRPAIAVHLKNNPRVSGESNANMAVWHDFFVDVGGDAMFFLVGNEDVPSEIVQLSNVRRVLDSGGSAARDLAVITRSDGFMGMASAFCQAATFSNLPYVIFKNPDHHKREMEREIGADDGFKFAGPRQKLWMKFESRENLMQALTMISHSV